ncbi:MAG: class I tRNA ligase family protein, partial [Patescibacteria group bacterium]
QAEDVDLDKSEERIVNKTIKKVSKDIDSLKFNTAIASLMEMVNEISKISSKGKPVKAKMIEALCLMLAPFAPFMAEEIWREVLKKEKSVHKENWPEFDENLTKEEKIIFVIQVNGKMRGQLEVFLEDSKNQGKIEALAQKDENTLKFLKDKDIKKTIFVAGKIINFVV